MTKLLMQLFTETGLKMFDINAPIEQQFTVSSIKAHAICDSGLDVPYPLSVWIDKVLTPVGYTRTGRMDLNCETRFDLITRPAQLPLIVSYLNIYLHSPNINHRTLNIATCQRNEYCLATVEFTYNPNNHESSCKTVWTKEVAE